MRSTALAVCIAITLGLAPSAALPEPGSGSASRRPSRTAARARPASAPAPSGWEARLPVQRHVLANGLVVLLHEDHSVPAVTLWQWFRVGSRDERPGRTGISHLFEHMMFNGSKNVPPKEYDRIIESNGGNSNAFTDRDMTAYYEDIAADRLEVLLRLDSDRMRGLRLDPDPLRNEIEVVKEERRLRIENDVEGLLDAALYATAFEKSSYGWPVLGRAADLDSLTGDELADYFRIHYAPNNCILILTGDFESRSALALIQRSFADIPAQPRVAAPADSEPEQSAERRIEVRHPAENVSFQVGYKAPSAAAAEAATLEVLSALLSEGESSRLSRVLTYEKQIALDVGTFYRPRLGPALFEVYVEMKPGRSAAEGLAVVDQVLDELAREGPTARELEKAKNLLEASFVRSLKTNNGVGEQLGFHEHVFGDYRALFRQVDRIRGVTAKDCQRLAAQVFDARRRTVAVLAPTEDPSESKP